MKLFYILVVDILFNAGYSVASSKAEGVAEIVGSNLKSSGFDSFKQQDKYISFAEFKDGISKLDEYRSSYSPRAGELAAKLKNYLENATNTYFFSSHSVYDQCGRAVERLQLYVRFLDDFRKGNAAEQNRIAVKVLDEILKITTEARHNLVASSKSFNNASEYIVALITQFNADSDGNSVNNKLAIAQKFHNDLQQTVKTSDAKINDEIPAVGDVEVQAQFTLNNINYVVDIGDGNFDLEFWTTIKNQVEELIKECHKYRTRHID